MSQNHYGDKSDTNNVRICDAVSVQAIITASTYFLARIAPR